MCLAQAGAGGMTQSGERLSVAGLSGDGSCTCVSALIEVWRGRKEHAVLFLPTRPGEAKSRHVFGESLRGRGWPGLSPWAEAACGGGGHRPPRPWLSCQRCEGLWQRALPSAAPAPRLCRGRDGVEGGIGANPVQGSPRHLYLVQPIPSEQTARSAAAAASPACSAQQQQKAGSRREALRVPSPWQQRAGGPRLPLAREVKTILMVPGVQARCPQGPSSLRKPSSLTDGNSHAAQILTPGGPSPLHSHSLPAPGSPGLRVSLTHARGLGLLQEVGAQARTGLCVLQVQAGE